MGSRIGHLRYLYSIKFIFRTQHDDYSMQAKVYLRGIGMLVEIANTLSLSRGFHCRLRNAKCAVSTITLGKKCTPDQVNASNHQYKECRFHEYALINSVLDHSTKTHPKNRSRDQDCRKNQGIQV